MLASLEPYYNSGCDHSAMRQFKLARKAVVAFKRLFTNGYLHGSCHRSPKQVVAASGHCSLEDNSVLSWPVTLFLHDHRAPLAVSSLGARASRYARKWTRDASQKLHQKSGAEASAELLVDMRVRDMLKNEADQLGFILRKSTVHAIFMYFPSNNGKVHRKGEFVPYWCSGTGEARPVAMGCASKSDQRLWHSEMRDKDCPKHVLWSNGESSQCAWNHTYVPAVGG